MDFRWSPPPSDLAALTSRRQTAWRIVDPVCVRRGFFIWRAFPAPVGSISVFQAPGRGYFRSGSPLFRHSDLLFGGRPLWFFSRLYFGFRHLRRSADRALAPGRSGLWSADFRLPGVLAGYPVRVAAGPSGDRPAGGAPASMGAVCCLRSGSCVLGVCAAEKQMRQL